MKTICKMLILPAVMLLCTATGAQAQKIGKVKDRLAIPESGVNGRTASVEVYESGDAGSTVRRGESAGSVQTAGGFRIVIFFDNGSTARSEAEKILDNFSRTYPDVRCDIRYENPYFKVLAGNCVTSEEAVILLGRIRSSYPEAYIMREDIPLQNFVTPKSQETNDLGTDEAVDVRTIEII